MSIRQVRFLNRRVRKRIATEIVSHPLKIPATAKKIQTAPRVKENSMTRQTAIAKTEVKLMS